MTSELTNQQQARISDGSSATLPASRPNDPAEGSAASEGDSYLGNLPVQVDVCIPLRGFRVADLAALEKERVLESYWGATEDLPLWCGDVQLLWSEFEVVDQRIAVRVTRLV